MELEYVIADDRGVSKNYDKEYWDKESRDNIKLRDAQREAIKSPKKKKE